MSGAFDAPPVRETVILAALERLETRPTRLVDTFALGCVLQSARLVEASLMKLDREPLARERHLSKVGSKTKERLQDIKDDDMFLGLTIGQIRKFYKVHRQTSLFFCFGRPKRLETDRPLPVFNIFLIIFFSSGRSSWTKERRRGTSSRPRTRCVRSSCLSVAFEGSRAVETSGALTTYLLALLAVPGEGGPFPLTETCANQTISTTCLRQQHHRIQVMPCPFSLSSRPLARLPFAHAPFSLQVRFLFPS